MIVVASSAMMTAQQQTNGSLHSPPFDKDIGGRMKLPEPRRQSLPASPLQISTSANQLPQDQSSSFKVTTRPTFTPQRATTVPNLTLRTAYADTTAKSSVPSEQKQNEGRAEPPSPSICRSPTWSRSTSQKQKKSDKKQEKERKEQERERKEQEKMVKKEARKLSKGSEGTRTGRRLSKKPPPAAMETQRMAASLTWPPVESNSQATSRESSSPASRRSSVTSLSSIMRFSSFLKKKGSSSQTESPIEFTTDDELRQLGPPAGFESLTSFTSRGSDSDDTFVKDLMDHRPHAEEPAQKTLSTATSKSDVKRHRTSLAPLSSNPPNDSPVNRTSKTSASTMDGSILGAVPAKQNSEKDTDPHGARKKHAGKKDNNMGSSYQSFTKFLRPEPRKNKANTGSSSAPNDSFQSFPYAKSNSSPNVLTNSMTPNSADGGFVRKQRVFQQQRSMADYQDPLVMQSANDLLNANNARWPPRLDVSVDSLPPSTRTDSVDSLAPRAKVVDGVADLFKNPTKLEVDSQNTKVPSSTQEVPVHHSTSFDQQSHKSDLDSISTSKQSITTKILGTQTGEASKLLQSSTQPQRPRRLQEGSSFPTEIPGHGRSTGRRFSLVQNKDLVAGTSTEHAEKQSGSMSSSVSLELPKLPRSSTDLPLPSFVKKALEVTSKSKVVGPNMTKDGEKAEQGKSTNGEKSNHQEIIVEGVNGDGLVRKVSLRRPRSDPELKAVIEKVKSPSLDFLPELKHQPLVKPKRTSARVSFKTQEEIVPHSASGLPNSSSMMEFTTPSPMTALQAMPKPSIPVTTNPRRYSALHSPNRTGFGSPQLMQAAHGPATEQAMNAKPVAKLFVICCKCNFWHDLPSRLYEAMAVPQTLNTDDAMIQATDKPTDKSHLAKTPLERANLLEGKVITAVKCPWCGHGMSTNCCAGWTAVVYLHERHH